MSKIITIITVILEILFATTMVFAATSNEVMPSAISSSEENSVNSAYVMPPAESVYADKPIMGFFVHYNIIQLVRLLVLLLILIIIIWTIILIIKNIKAGKNKNQIIRYGIKNLLWIWFPEIVCFGIIGITREYTTALDGPSDEYYLIIQSILLIISILALIPQILIIKDLRKNLKGVEVNAIQNEKDKPQILIVAFTIIWYCLLVIWIVYNCNFIFR